ncbi:hypothetical protein [Acidianus sp. HS-5]|uniref:hypothetical protein n=1 Tax=Acidianus sp. HS-5 TaxID=2886040 RepID=UPI001F29D7C4|nr:hypothetical protein [Acidianus sp. HS-5]BDC17443.1 hypothetical protein HS5_03330 [Acidianus sp. HS-5]
MYNVETIINECRNIQNISEEVIRSCIRSLFWELVIFIAYNSSPKRRLQFLNVSDGRSSGIRERTLYNILRDATARLVNNNIITEFEKKKLDYLISSLAILRTLADHYGDLKRLKNLRPNTRIDEIKIEYPPTIKARLMSNGVVEIMYTSFPTPSHPLRIKSIEYCNKSIFRVSFDIKLAISITEEILRILNRKVNNSKLVELI